VRNPSRLLLYCLLIICVIPASCSCSDDRPVGNSLKPDRNVDELIVDLYRPDERAKAAKRLLPFARFMVPKLTAEVTDVSKDSAGEVEARIIMLEMLGRLDREPKIDGLLIRINRDSSNPKELRDAAADIARARASRRAKKPESR